MAEQRDIERIIRLGAGRDLAIFVNAAISVIEAWQDADADGVRLEIDQDSQAAADRFADAMRHAIGALYAVVHGHPGPHETAAEALLKELRNR